MTTQISNSNNSLLQQISSQNNLNVRTPSNDESAPIGMSTQSTIQSQQQNPPTESRRDHCCCLGRCLRSIYYWFVFIFTFGQYNLFPRAPRRQEQLQPLQEEQSAQLASTQTITETQFIDPNDTSPDALVNRLYNILNSKEATVLKAANVFSVNVPPNFNGARQLVDRLRQEPLSEISQDTDLALIGCAFIFLLGQRDPKLIPASSSVYRTFKECGGVLLSDGAKDLDRYLRTLNDSLVSMEPTSRELFHKVVNLIAQTSKPEDLRLFLNQILPVFLGVAGERENELDRKFVKESIANIIENKDDFDWGPYQNRGAEYRSSGRAFGGFFS